MLTLLLGFSACTDQAISIEKNLEGDCWNISDTLSLDFANEDTKTPMIYAGISMIINVAVSLALFPIYGHVGIAIATTIAGWANALLLGLTLHQRGLFVADTELLAKLPRILLASLIMGAALYGLSTYMTPYFAQENGLAIRLSALLLLVTCGILTYALSAQLTGAARLRDLKAGLRKNEHNH